MVRQVLADDALEHRILQVLMEEEAASLGALIARTDLGSGAVCKCLRHLALRGEVRRIRPAFPPGRAGNRKQWYLRNVYYRPVGPRDGAFTWQQQLIEQPTSV